MNKVDCILEQFDFDPFGLTIDPYYDNAMYEDGQQFLEDTIKTAGSQVSKKNFAQKIWDAIKKIWAWLCKQWGRFVAWLKKVFGRKNAKTADQVASEVITGSSPVDSGASTSNVDPKPANAVSNLGSANVQKSGSIQSIKVDIPSNPASEAPPEPSIDVLIKPILISYDSVKEQFGISINDANNKSDGKVKGQSNTAPKDYATLLVLIDRPDIFDKLKSAVIALRDKKVNTDFLRLLDEFDKAINGWTVKTNWVVPFGELSKFQVSLNEVMDIIGGVNIAEDTIFEDVNIMKRFNDLAGYCARLQMSMNSFTRVAQSVHTIDAQYMGSIKNPETLDKFVNALINAGIPPKYIGYNTYLACDQTLKGSKGDETNPIWGQSRLVLFPDDRPSDIIKVALSGWGIQSNKSEYSTSQQFVKYRRDDLISVTKSIGATGATVNAERVEANGKSIPSNKVAAFKDEINHFIDVRKIPYQIGDLHGGNIGTKNGKVVAIDYAWASRRSTDKSS